MSRNNVNAKNESTSMTSCSQEDASWLRDGGLGLGRRLAAAGGGDGERPTDGHLVLARHDRRAGRERDGVTVFAEPALLEQAVEVGLHGAAERLVGGGPRGVADEVAEAGRRR